jgi:hypothetical protein
MDEFARLMSMEGVRALDQPEKRSSRLAEQPCPVSGRGIVSPPEMGPRWPRVVTGPRAPTALETALERLDTEIRDGRRGWATGIRQDGIGGHAACFVRSSIAA